MRKLLLLLTDWELLKKPKSTQIRENTVKDILSVDGKKWFHPKLPDGKTNPFWGTIEIIDGKEVCKEGTVDLYIYEHPDLNYRIADVPLMTCKEGEFKNVTDKDCKIIRDVLYSSHDDRPSTKINLKLANNFWYILYRKSKYWHSLFIFLLALGLSFYFFTKITIAVIGLLCFIGLFGYCFEQTIKQVKEIWFKS